MRSGTGREVQPGHDHLHKGGPDGADSEGGRLRLAWPAMGLTEISAENGGDARCSVGAMQGHLHSSLHRGLVLPIYAIEGGPGSPSQPAKFHAPVPVLLIVDPFDEEEVDVLID